MILSTVLLSLLAASAQAKEPDWTKVRDEAASHLQDLIRIDTSNPPGNELRAAQYIGKLLKKENIPYEILISTPGRANIVARLRGTGKKKPILLTGHLDVVGVQRDKWSVDPFAGISKDAVIYGRGAVDDKGLLIASLEALILLKRSGQPLDRDVIFLGVADEESGSDYGMVWVLKNHLAKVQAEFAINEGGRTELSNGQVKSVAIQTAEKLYHDFKLKAKGTAGHSSVPLPDSAIYRLAQALGRLSQYKTPIRLDSSARSFLQEMAKKHGPEFTAALKDLESTDLKTIEAAYETLYRHNPRYSSLLRTSIAPTIVQAGFRANVIPSEAEAIVNCRLLPDERTEDFLAQLKRVVADPGIEITIVQAPGAAPPSTSIETDLFRAFVKSGAKLAPGAGVVPYMSTGATDSRYLRDHGIPAYGFSVPLSDDDALRIHGHDERIPVDSLLFGVKFLYHSTQEASRPQP